MSGRFLNFFRLSSNISTYLSRTLIIITITTTILIGSVMIFHQTHYFNKLIEQRAQEYVQTQKGYIEEVVNNEFTYIHIQNEYFKADINNRIKHNVNQAYYTAEAIYNKYVGRKSENEIKELIINTISSIRFDMEYEEVFISTMDKVGVYYPRNPEFSGKDMSQFKDNNGLPVIQKEIDFLKHNNEGFIDYEQMQDTGKRISLHKKISYVKKFKYFNWYFGSKQYMDDYFPKFRSEIAQKISSIKIRHGGGSAFMNNIDGTPIVMGGKIYEGDLNMRTTDNKLFREVFQEELDIISKNPEGDFFTYQWPQGDNNAISTKCSFIKLYKEYNWIIGAGFFMDEINHKLDQQQKSLHEDLRKSILVILIIFLVILAIEIMIVYHFNDKYKSDFDRFFNFFFSLQSKFSSISTSSFYFDEFKRAGEAANEMVSSRREIENKLIEEQERATESDRLKSAFLANMSHEIRTPMNAILGFSELLEDEDIGEDEKSTFIKLIKKNGGTLMNLINDIVDISKIEANLLSISKKKAKLADIIDDINAHYTELINSLNNKDLTFKVESNISPDQIIFTDVIRLRQIIDNLIGNAIKFTPSGTITFGVKKDGSRFFYSVTDTGIGIPADRQQLIFERFMQAHNGTNANFGGTGLGLAISKNLVELLDGEIFVESEVGKGSMFFFHLPVE